MNPLVAYEEVCRRSDQIAQLHTYLSKNVTGAMPLDDLLRSEWAMRVSALDLYVHELAAQRMVEIFEGKRLPSAAFRRFQIPYDVMHRIRLAGTQAEATSAFDLEVRNQFGYKTFQYPDDIAFAVRHCSDVELWVEVAVGLGAATSEKVERAKSIKRDLSLIVQRRNKIVHEGDLQPSIPRTPWPITEGDLSFVRQEIDRIVRAIDGLLT